MSLLSPDLTITLQQQHRLACVLDPALILSPYGLALSRLGEVLELWVVRELWHLLDNTHFYMQRPSVLAAAMTAAPLTDSDPVCQEALQALLDWERWRLENDQTGLKLFWVGDEPSGSLLPTHVDASLVWRYEALACALDHSASRVEPPEQVLAAAFRDAAALAAALRTSCILARCPLATAPDSPLPPLCAALVRWGVTCTPLPAYDPLVHIERNYLRHVFVQAGLSPLLWAGWRPAVVHLWVPGVSTLWPVLREASFAGIEELTEPPLPPCSADRLWQAAQGFWYLL